MLSIIIDEVIRANFLEGVDFGCLHVSLDHFDEIFERTTEGVLVASALPIALEAFLVGRLIVGLAILQFDAQAEVNFWVRVDDACLAIRHGRESKDEVGNAWDHARCCIDG